MPITYEVKGLKELQVYVGKLDKQVTSEIKAEIYETALLVSSLAKRDAPADEGVLRRSISVKKEPEENTWSVVVQANHAPYMEWGTKGKAVVPPELADYAAQFRGKGTGTFKEMMENLIAWVGRKGIAGTYSTKTRRRTGNKAVRQTQDRSLAYLIARKILKYGVEPHPFLFKHKPEAMARLKLKLFNIFNRIK